MEIAFKVKTQNIIKISEVKWVKTLYTLTWNYKKSIHANTLLTVINKLLNNVRVTNKDYEIISLKIYDL